MMIPQPSIIRYTFASGETITFEYGPPLMDYKWTVYYSNGTRSRCITYLPENVEPSTEIARTLLVVGRDKKND